MTIKVYHSSTICTYLDVLFNLITAQYNLMDLQKRPKSAVSVLTGLNDQIYQEQFHMLYFTFPLYFSSLWQELLFLFRFINIILAAKLAFYETIKF